MPLDALVPVGAKIRRRLHCSRMFASSALRASQTPISPTRSASFATPRWTSSLFRSRGRDMSTMSPSASNGCRRSRQGAASNGNRGLRSTYTEVMLPLGESRGVARVKRAALRFVLLWIPVGFAINVAVAWGLAAWMPHERWNVQFVVGASRIGGIRYYTTGACRRSWQRTYVDSFTTAHSAFTGAIKDSQIRQKFQEDESLKGQRWGRAAAYRDDPSTFEWVGIEHATGWPCLTVWCDWTCESVAKDERLLLIPQYVSYGGIPISASPANVGTIRPYELRALPLRPIWLGLIVNTAFYAALSAALWAGLIAFRSWRRAVRGRCTRCNYNLTGLGPGTPCPECGSEARRLAR